MTSAADRSRRDFPAVYSPGTARPASRIAPAGTFPASGQRRDNGSRQTVDGRRRKLPVPSAAKRRRAIRFWSKSAGRERYPPRKGCGFYRSQVAADDVLAAHLEKGAVVAVAVGFTVEDEMPGEAAI